MRDDTILEKLADAESVDSAIGHFHYHGTGETFDDDPHGGGFDQIFWCADTPAIAQCYIPASGSSTLLSVDSFAMNDRLRPSLSPSGVPMGLYAVALQLGFPPARNIECDRFGSSKSFTCSDGYPRNIDVVNALAGLGYPWNPGRDFSAWVKTAHEGDIERFKPADYRMAGRLFVVEGVRDLQLLDLATGRDGDLGDPHHLKLEVFHRAMASGYDGIIIPDYCQSTNHGNVGHTSWGIFPKAIHRLRYAVIPSVRFDWSADEFCDEQVTPEFKQAWLEQRSQESIFNRR